MFIKLSRIFLFLCVVFSARSSQGAQVLFSLSYGTDDNQIHMYVPTLEGEDMGTPTGPFWFFVDKAHNVFYIADTDMIIKKFTMAGQYLNSIKFDSLLVMRSFILDADENIYIVHGASSENISKANQSGNVLWTKSLSQITQSNTNYLGIGNISIDSNKDLCLEIYLLNGIGYIKLDSNGVYLQDVISIYFDVLNNSYVFKPQYLFGNLFLDDERSAGDYVSGFDVDIINSNNNDTKTLKISLPDEYLKLDNLRDVLEKYVDSEGNIYTLSFVSRDISEKVTLGNGLFIDSDNMIYKFNTSGKLVSKIKFPAEPITNLGKRFQVDNEGNLYYLQFNADKMDVIEIPGDAIPPTTVATLLPLPNSSGWNNSDVTVTFSATDNDGGSGVKQIQYSLSGAQTLSTQTISGNAANVTISTEGTTTLTYFATDNAGNVEQSKTLTFKIDKTPLVISGMPAAGYSLWPPNHKLVKVAIVSAASDSLSGLASGSFNVTGTSNEASDPKNPDIVITPNTSGGFDVQLLSERDGKGTGRVYTLTATATDNAGNITTTTATCIVPHDQGNK